MAEEPSRRRKPRIRKAAPTIREQVEAAQAKKDQVKSGKVRQTAAKLKGPLKKVRLPSNRATGQLAQVARLLAKPLRWLGLGYFINAWREVRQVTWPTRRETWRLTLAVFVFAVVFGSVAFGVDKALDVVFKHTVLK